MVPWAELAWHHAADTARNKTGVISCLVVSIILKQGRSRVSEGYHQMLEAVSEDDRYACSYTSRYIHTALLTQSSGQCCKLSNKATKIKL